jgi:DNA-binding transcriptional regulator YiaG
VNGQRQQQQGLSLFRERLLEREERRAEADRIEAIRESVDMRTTVLQRLFGIRGQTRGQLFGGFFN